MNETHIVVGATGSLGHALTLRLLSEQIPVRAVVRATDRAEELLPDNVEVVTADATELDSLKSACKDAAVIYNCVYVAAEKWPMVTDNFIEAARDNQSRLVFPTNIHPYGPLQKVPATEDHPLAAASQRGRMRIRMETKLLEASRAGDAQVILPRLAAFYGPTVRDGYIPMVFVSALAKQKAWWYGSLEMPYDLICADDAATACLLLSTKEGAESQVWHVPGAGALTGGQFISMVFKAAGAEPLMGARTRRTFQLLGLIYPPARMILEVMYEFEHPLVMDGGKFAAAFPDYKYTTHEQAIPETLEWLRQK